jgi:hypothetical protein
MSNFSFDKRALGQVIDQAVQKALLFGTVADLTSRRASENEPIELDRIERRTVRARRPAAGRQRCDWLSANRDGMQRPLGSNCTQEPR